MELSEKAETTKVQIKHRSTGAVIFECEAPEGMGSGLHTRHALKSAVKAGANLSWADLSGAYLSGAYISGANLSRANLSGADLSGANLDGAYLSGAKLIGSRPVFQIGPIGSRSAYFVAYLTDQGIKLRTGCFFGTVEEFSEKLAKEHGENNHATEYKAALALIQSHADLWGSGVSK